MRLLLIIFSSLFAGSTVFTQELNFDSLFFKTSKDIVDSEPEESLKSVDYLYKVSKDDKQRVRSLVLKASFLLYYGLNDEALTIFFEAEKIAKNNKDYVSLTRIYGYISTVYRESELYSSSLKYIEKALQSTEKIEEHDSKWRFFGNLEQEKANIEMERENHLESIKLAHHSVQYFSKIKSDSLVDTHYQLLVSYGLISKNYLLLNEIDSSFYYLDKAKESLDKSDLPNSPLEGSIYNGIGEAHFANKAYEKAEEYFLKAKKIADETNYFSLKKDVYKSLSNLYKETNEDQKFIAINEQYIDMILQDQKSRKFVADKLLNSLYDQQLEDETTRSKNLKIITWLTILSLALVSILIWYIHNKRQNQKKFQAFINELNNKPTKKIEVSEPENTKNYMSAEKEMSILESLKEFEDSEFFLDKNISLNGLSSKVGVNQRYLTYVIKQHLASDFATYINELRINYIVNYIKSDPKHLEYKISYLAEQCGFSSHSRFTINFKKITGKNPSTFINYVREENKKKQKTENSITN